MPERTPEPDRRHGQPHPIVPHVVVSVALGVVFVVAVVLVAALPALAVTDLLVDIAVHDVVVLVLRAASAVTTVVAYLLISRTFVRAVLHRRVVARLLTVGAAKE